MAPAKRPRRVRRPAVNAAVLWTGGKDASMALHEALGQDCDVRCLATFAPAEPAFLAHPLSVVRLQAEALGLPHRLLTVGEPFEQGYENGLRRLREEFAIDCVVTGDIAEVDGQPNWIRARGRAAGMAVQTPLWGRDRLTLLRQMLRAGFSARISCIDTRWLDPDWVGRTLDGQAVGELRAVRRRNGLDLCGENGEYHTLVVDGPPFARVIDIHAFTVRRAARLAYMDIDGLELRDRTP